MGTPTDYHDMAILSNGNHLVTTYVPRAHVDLSSIGEGTDQTVLDAHIQEVGPNGTLVWEWHSEDHIAVGETREHARFAYPNLGMVLDLLHVNAISEDGEAMSGLRICSSNVAVSTITTEQDAAGNKLFELRFATAISHRGVPIAPTELSRDALAAGMDAKPPR